MAANTNDFPSLGRGALTEIEIKNKKGTLNVSSDLIFTITALSNDWAKWVSKNKNIEGYTPPSNLTLSPV